MRKLFLTRLYNERLGETVASCTALCRRKDAQPATETEVVHRTFSVVELTAHTTAGLVEIDIYTTLIIYI